MIQLTHDEWEAIAVLRAAAGVGIKHGMLALPESVQRAIDVARGLMDRTRDGLVYSKNE